MVNLLRGAVLGAALAMSAALLAPAPAHATVHEIVAQWCSGHDELLPPGVTGGSNEKADNLAKPLFANGFIAGTVPFDPGDGRDPGVLIVFDFGAKASKVVGTGVFVAVDETPAGPLYIEVFELDPSFPAFQRCPRLVG